MLAKFQMLVGATLLVSVLSGCLSTSPPQSEDLVSEGSTLVWDFVPELGPTGSWMKEGNASVQQIADRIKAFDPGPAWPDDCDRYRTPHDHLWHLRLRGAVEMILDQCTLIPQAQRAIADADDPVEEYWTQRAAMNKTIDDLIVLVGNKSASTLAEVEFQYIMMGQVLGARGVLAGADRHISNVDYDGTGEDEADLLSAWFSFMKAKMMAGLLERMLDQWFPEQEHRCVYVGPQDLYERVWAKAEEHGNSIVAYRGERENWMTYEGKVILGSADARMKTAEREGWTPMLVAYESWVSFWGEYARILAEEDPVHLPDFEASRLMLDQAESGRTITTDTQYRYIEAFDELSWPYQPASALKLRAMLAFEWTFPDRFDCPA